MVRVWERERVRVRERGSWPLALAAAKRLATGGSRTTDNLC